MTHPNHQRTLRVMAGVMQEPTEADQRAACLAGAEALEAMIRWQDAERAWGAAPVGPDPTRAARMNRVIAAEAALLAAPLPETEDKVDG